MVCLVWICIQFYLNFLGYRQPNQTDKQDTGTFDREALLEYLEEQSRSIPDREDLVPHISGQKRGKIFQYVYI